VAGVPARIVREHTVAGWRPSREEASRDAARPRFPVAGDL
jgi:hypothetical protein